MFLTQCSSHPSIPHLFNACTTAKKFKMALHNFFNVLSTSTTHTTWSFFMINIPIPLMHALFHTTKFVSRSTVLELVH